MEIQRPDVVIVYEDKSEALRITKDPKKGKKVPYKNVVKEIIKIGEWLGNDMLHELPMATSQMSRGTAAVVVVQEPQGGPIVAVAKVAYQPSVQTTFSRNGCIWCCDIKACGSPKSGIPKPF
ncbi:putative DUF1223-domain-containing protein [Seiridium cardinale]